MLYKVFECNEGALCKVLEYNQILPALGFLETLWAQGGAKHLLTAQKSSTQWVQWSKGALTPSGGDSSFQLLFPSRISQYLFLNISFIPDTCSNTK